MHEFGLCEGMVAAVESRAQGRPVARVGVRVGARHHVVDAAFQQAFEMVAAGSAADGADLEITVVPVAGRCGDCGRSTESTDPLPVCTDCGGALTELVGGDDLVLEWIRYRDAVVVPDRAADEVRS